MSSYKLFSAQRFNSLPCKDTEISHNSISEGNLAGNIIKIGLKSNRLCDVVYNHLSKPIRNISNYLFSLFSQVLKNLPDLTSTHVHEKASDGDYTPTLRCILNRKTYFTASLSEQFLVDTVQFVVDAAKIMDIHLKTCTTLSLEGRKSYQILPLRHAHLLHDGPEPALELQQLLRVFPCGFNKQQILRSENRKQKQINK